MYFRLASPLALVALTAACAASPSRERDQSPSRPEGRGVTPPLEGRAGADGGPEISFDFEDLALTDAAAAITSLSGRMVLVDPEIHERVTVSLKKIPWRDAVDVIAKMTKCEVEPVGNIAARIVPGCCRITVDFADAPTRTVLQLLANYAGSNVVIGPEEISPTTIDLSTDGFDWRGGLKKVVALHGLSIGRVGEILVISRNPRRCGELGSGSPVRESCFVNEAALPEGRVAVDAESAPTRDVLADIARQIGCRADIAPSVSGAVTIHVREVRWKDAFSYLAGKHAGLRVQHEAGVLRFWDESKALLASNAPIRAWFELLAAGMGKKAVLPRETVGRISVALFSTTYEDVLVATASAHGYSAKIEGDTILIADEEPNRVRPLEPVVRPVALPDGRTVEVSLEGVLLLPESGKSRAVLSGRVYSLGDELRNAGGQRIAGPVRVAAIYEEAIDLEVGPPGGPRMTVKLASQH